MKPTVIVSILILLGLSIAMIEQRAAADRPASGEAAPTQTPSDKETSPLDELAWMVGQWVDDESESTVWTRCSWTENHKFLTQSFRINVNGKVALEGTQKIGWDPIEQRIRSWIFDSAGGFGEGRWIKDGNRWEVKTTFVLTNGERASAINVTTRVDANRYRWQSIDREIGGEMQPSIPEVTVVREKPGATKTQNEKETSR